MEQNLKSKILVTRSHKMTSPEKKKKIKIIEQNILQANEITFQKTRSCKRKKKFPIVIEKDGKRQPVGIPMKSFGEYTQYRDH
jgi:hypothetical protein